MRTLESQGPDRCSERQRVASLRKDPSYLSLTLVLPAAVVLTTSASPLSLPGLVGLFICAGSFITLGTVGYGDVTPASPLARSLSLIEAVSGITYVATMIARFVSIQLAAEHGRSPEP